MRREERRNEKKPCKFAHDPNWRRDDQASPIITVSFVFFKLRCMLFVFVWLYGMFC